MHFLSTIVHRFGKARDVVEFDETGVPDPDPGEVVVRMLKSVINPSDIITISGAYRARVRVPFRPGYEGVGRIVKLGAGLSDLKVGTHVLPIGSAGAWSTHKRVAAAWCFPISERLSIAQAATLYVNPGTAWLMLHERARVRPDMTVIVSAAASEIGRMLIRMLNRIGIAPLVTVRRPPSAERFAGLSLRGVVVTAEPGFEGDLLEASDGGRADLVLDAVGGDVGTLLARLLKPGGRFIHYGLLSGVPLTPQTWACRPDIRFELFSLRDWVHGRSRGEIAALFERLESLSLEGVAASEIDSVYGIADIKDAFDRLDSGARRGKVLLDPAM